MISLAMIVKNEEATLAHCLESVVALVDELIIVDTGSTDKTVEIAKGFGAQVHHFQWCDDFAAARNESLKYCKGDWVLIMDADEAIDPLDYEKIKNACLNPQADAYLVTTRNYMTHSNFSTNDIGAVPNQSSYLEGKSFPFYSDNVVLRLARSFNGLSFSGRIHETLEQSLYSQGKTVEMLDVVIHHYGKLLNDREEYKAQYYFMLAKKEADAKPNDGDAQYRLLQQALVAKQWEVALEAAQSCIAINPKADSFILYGKGLALQELGRHQEALESFDSLLSQDPEHVMGLAYKGFSLVTLGKVDAGCQFVLKAIELKPTFVSGRLYLAKLEFNKGDMSAARKIIWDAINAIPNEPSLYDLLLTIELTDNNPQQAAEAAMLGLQRCPDGADEKLPRYVALYYRQIAEIELSQNNFDEARKIAMDVIAVLPNEPVFYDILLRLEMSRGNHQQAAKDAMLGIKNCPNGGNGVWYRLAAVYLYQKGENKIARSVIETGIEAFPNDLELIRLKGII